MSTMQMRSKQGEKVRWAFRRTGSRGHSAAKERGAASKEEEISRDGQACLFSCGFTTPNRGLQKQTRVIEERTNPKSGQNQFTLILSGQPKSCLANPVERGVKDDGRSF
jgi:hypothetical protein